MSFDSIVYQYRFDIFPINSYNDTTHILKLFFFSLDKAFDHIDVRDEHDFEIMKRKLELKEMRVFITKAETKSLKTTFYGQ